MQKTIGKILPLIGVILIAVLFMGCNKLSTHNEATKKLTKKDLATEKAKLSYALGADLAKNMKRSKIDIDTNLFYEGFKIGFAKDATPLMSDDEIRVTMDNLRKDQLQKRKDARNAELKNNLDAGQKFLAGKAQEKGVVALPSGLLYKVLKEGNGPIPKATDTIECHYRGTTIDGKEFDSSFKRNKPARFQVNRVIKGWTEALQKMKVGSKWQLYIPSKLAYGNRPVGQHIPPGSTLVFEVELLNIQPNQPKK